MPALRAMALLLFLLGTVLGAAGILRDNLDLTIAGALLWMVGVAVGLFAHRLFKTR